jgi:inosine-uridine nucleoside N-ribohydrolase
LTRPTHTTKIGLARLNCLSAHDAVAVAELVRPGAPDNGVRERRGGLLVGAFARTHGRRYRSGRSGRDPHARVAVDVDTVAFVRLLIERLRTLG